MKFITTLLSSVLMLASFGLSAADIKKGNWEMTYTTTMEGMPMAIDIPTKTVAQCIDSDEFVPESSEDGDCTHSSRRASEDKIEWNISCASNNMMGKGEMVFAGTTMKGSMEMKVDMLGQKIETKVDIEGKYIGKCE